jgi:hypothetical protein
MATRSTPRKSENEKPAAKEATAKNAAASGPAASAQVKPATGAKKRLPAATIRALAELEAGELNRYADADEMLRDLGHERGRREGATRPASKAARPSGAAS